jgi:hypothetical protein
MYCTPAELRIEGVTEEQADDATLEKRIKAACEKIDLWTRLWFEPREKTFLSSGRGGRLLYLDIPAIALTSVFVNGEIVPVSNIRIVDDGYSLFLQSGWRSGTFNIEITGVFGLAVPDADSPTGYAPPSPIVEVAKRLTLREIVPLTDSDAQNDIRRAGRIVSETTDGHSYTLVSAGNTANAATIGTYGNWTGDSFIDGILLNYQAPVKVGCA